MHVMVRHLPRSFERTAGEDLEAAADAVEAVTEQWALVGRS